MIQVLLSFILVVTFIVHMAENSSAAKQQVKQYLMERNK